MSFSRGTGLALSARDRRTLAMGAVAVSALVALARGVPAWRVWRDDAMASAAELRAEAARAEGAVRARRSVRDSLVARRARYLGLAPALVAGDTPAAAGATLAAMVSGAATGAGLRVGAVQVMPAREDARSAGGTARGRRASGGAAAFAVVAVRADATGDVAGLTRWLATLERGPALLAVRQLGVSQPEPAAPDDRAEALRVEVVVEGLALRAAPNGKAGGGR